LHICFGGIFGFALPLGELKIRHLRRCRELAVDCYICNFQILQLQKTRPVLLFGLLTGEKITPGIDPQSRREVVPDTPRRLNRSRWTLAIPLEMPVFDGSLTFRDHFSAHGTGAYYMQLLIDHPLYRVQLSLDENE
jgi:hypothetical protein